MKLDAYLDFEHCTSCGDELEWDDDPSDPVSDTPPWPMTAKCIGCGARYSAVPDISWIIDRV